MVELCLEVMAVYLDITRRRIEKSGEDRHHRGLSGSVVAEESENLSFVERERDTVESPNL